MIDKFIGDCVMALFGAPEPQSDAPDNAVKTAREMIRWLEVGNKKLRATMRWAPVRTTAHFPAFPAQIGPVNAAGY